MKAPSCAPWTDQYTLECAPWSAAASTDARFTTMVVKRMGGVMITLIGPIASPSTTQTRTGTTDAQGVAKFTDLPAGEYMVFPGSTAGADITWGGGRYGVWSSHSVPTGGRLVVERGSLRQATIMMRARRATGTPVRLRIRTYNRTNPFNMAFQNGAYMNQTVRLMPIPTGRTDVEHGSGTRGWTVIRAGDQWVDLNVSEPGLYSAQILHYPRGDISPIWDGAGAASRFVWIDANGSTIPSTLEIRQDRCDEAARHAIVEATCGNGFRWCYRPIFVGHCDDNPVPGGSGNDGSGGA